MNPQLSGRRSSVLRPYLLLPAASFLLLAGCNVSSSKTAHGDNVRLNTPFGDMHVRTDENANVGGIGLATYPGAVPVKEDDGKDKDAADIDFNFGDFHVGVKAASFQTSDSPDKVEAFYRKDMAHYGDVLKCRGNEAIGQPTRTAQGLTCNEENDHHIHAVSVDTGGDKFELRAGSPDHEYIVGIDPRDGGTRIGLVSLDLPVHHDKSDSE